MNWPDPYCPRNHAPGAVYRKWEHTPDCNRHAPTKVKKEQRITEVRKEIQPSRETTIVERARESGGF